MSATWLSIVAAQASSRPVDAVRAADVDDLGARGHRVHGLDVQRLLAVPAGAAALVDLVVAVRRRGDLGELVPAERRQAVPAVVGRGCPCTIVGEANASVTATVTPRPSMPCLIWSLTPYADWYCFGS